MMRASHPFPGTNSTPKYIPTNHSTGNNSATPQTGTASQSTTGRTWVENNSRVEMPRAYHEGNDSYGDYYNWYAATAETGTFAQTSGEATDSLCPAGWQLPVNGSDNGTTDKSWRKLLFNVTEGYGLSNNAKSSQTMRQIPLSIPFSGYYSWGSGVLGVRGSYGFFWSSTARSNGTSAYNLDFTSTNVNPQSSGNKVSGSTVRCVQK